MKLTLVGLGLALLLGATEASAAPASAPAAAMRRDSTRRRAAGCPSWCSATARSSASFATARVAPIAATRSGPGPKASTG